GIIHVALRRPERMKIAPGYASLPACRLRSVSELWKPARWKRCVPRDFPQEMNYEFRRKQNSPFRLRSETQRLSLPRSGYVLPRADRARTRRGDVRLGRGRQ